MPAGCYGEFLRRGPRDFDYETARQFAWAFRVVRGELKQKESPTLLPESSYYFNILDFSELSGLSQQGWNPDPIEYASSLLTEVVLLNLKKRRLSNPYPDSGFVPVIGKAHDRDQELRAKYRTESVKERFARIEQLLKEQVKTN